MKHTFACVALLPVLSAFAPNVHASSFRDSPYIGVDYMYTMIQYDKASDQQGFRIKYRDLLANDLHGVSPHIGMQFGEYLGTEFGYFRTQNKRKSYTSSNVNLNPPDTLINSTSHMSGYHADVIGHFPISDSVSALGSVGLIKARTKIKVSLYSSDLSDANPSDLTWRVGAGLRLNAYHNVGLRLMAHYMQPHFEDSGYSVAKDVLQFNAGMDFSF